jgi:hypothetical protein
MTWGDRLKSWPESGVEMNPFKPGDVVIVDLGKDVPSARVPTRVAVISESHGPLVRAIYVEGDHFYGSYVYCKFADQDSA